jgi:hypothetical protein
MGLFRSKHDIEYLKRVNKELVERVVGEKITYYAISNKFTRKNIYGESKEKIFDPPIEVYALVRWKDQTIKTDRFGQDVVYEIAFFPLLDTLREKNLSPREGDYVEYDAKRFEITQISYPRQMLGKEEENFYIKLDCVTVREGVFNTSVSGTAEDAARTRPDNQLTASFRYSDVLFPFSSSV